MTWIDQGVAEPLPSDVIDWLTRDFGDRSDAVSGLLLARRRIGQPRYIDDRLIRCMIHAARGEEHRVNQLIDRQQEDFRDVILAGEYDEANQHIRDLRASFLIDSPEKFWVGELACMMASRGYPLKDLQTHPATVGPIQFTTDCSEGTATFVGARGEIVIEKKDRQRAIQANRRDLAIHELERPFDDEPTFRDAVSGYLLSSVRVGECSD